MAKLFSGAHRCLAVVALWITIALASPATAQFIELDERNSTTDNLYNWRVPNDVTIRSGMLSRHIKQIGVIFSSAAVPVDRRQPPLREFRINEMQNSDDWAIVNGAFYAYQGRHPVPLGTVIRNGVPLWIDPSEPSRVRGAVIVTTDGRIAIVNPGVSEPDAIQATFADPVRDFVGGGILLIDDGKLTDVDAQMFRDRRLCRAQRHTLLGIRSGSAYLIYNYDERESMLISCEDYRNFLLNEGFTALIKMDGGSGFYYRDSAGEVKLAGDNPVGFLIWGK